MIFFERKVQYCIILIIFRFRHCISHNAMWMTKSDPFLPLRFTIFPKSDVNNELPFLELCIYQEWQRS